MPRSIKTLHFCLVTAAVLLSAFQGWLSNLGVLVFSAHESWRMWASIYAPAFVFLAAPFCYKFPRGGFIAYVAAFAMSLLLCVNPFGARPAPWADCMEGLRFGMYGGVLLLIDFVIFARSEATTVRPAH